ncbi:hypothetical protein [Halobacteriovorax sp.]|uniref:hypothetical protein n=1 Tax=Halobacteriovorax sp. TaxID=2020862 RepID=UPI00356AB108
MKHILLLVLALGLGACNNLEGTFKAKTDLVFKTKKGLLSRKYVSVKVPAKDYRAEFDFTSFGNLQIDLSGIKKTIKIKLPKDLDINDSNDEFYIQGSEVKQVYDFDGRISSKVTRGETRNVTESCTYTRYENRCRRVCRINDRGRQVCRSHCSREPVTVYGYQQVEYYNSTKNTTMRLKVLEPSTSESKGLFQGNNVSTHRVVTYQSVCR